MPRSTTRKTNPPSAAAIEELYLQAPPMDQVNMVREGVPWDVCEGYMCSVGMNDQAAAAMLHIPPRTLARRKKGRLDPQESERLLRLVRLVAKASQVLGTRAKALHWLGAPNRALGGAKPVSLLDTDIGTQAAEEVLARIEYGVIS